MALDGDVDEALSPLADVCRLADEMDCRIGHVAVTVTGSLRRMTEVWRGDLSWAQALRSGEITIQGPKELRRGVPSWFTLSPFAPVARPVG